MIDPEPFEATEDQFSATLEPGAPETGLQMETNHRARARYCDPSAKDTAEDAPATTATDSGDRISDLLPPRTRSGIEREFSERAELEHTLDQQSQFWRDEVASRVDSYRVRRSRKRLAGDFSMKLNFEPPSGAVGSRSGAAAAPAHAAAAAPLAQEWTEPIPVRAFHDAPEMLVNEDEAQEEDVQPVARRSAESPKIIEFPGPEFPRPGFPLEQAVRQPVFPAFSPADELADPVLDRPRILDAPEDVDIVVADPMSSVELRSKAEEDVTALAQAAFELPLQVAPLPHRFTAALLDSLLVLVGTAGFAMVVMKTAASVPHTRGALALAVIVPVLFWALYHYLFLVHAAMTPGMQMANLSISTFEGKPALRAVRRWRALVMVLSCVSLGLGFVWALFDEDNLCWHDKVTRTYLTMKR